MTITKENKDTELLSAIARHDIGTVRSLLDSGISVHGTREDKHTPLHHVAFYSNNDMAQLLLDHGADINAQTAIGKLTPLHHAVSANRFPMINFLLDHGANKEMTSCDNSTPSHDAAYQTHAVSLGSLLGGGANMGARDKDGLTLLHTAAFFNRRDPVIILLMCNANTDAQNNNGETPLGYAIKKNHRKTVAAYREFNDGTLKVSQFLYDTILATQSKRQRLGLLSIGYILSTRCKMTVDHPRIGR